MTVIYLDTLFLMNLWLDGLLLSASRRLAGCGVRWGRVVLAAAMGALYACGVFCTGWTWLTHPMVRGLGAVGMVWLAGGRKGLFRSLLLFLMLSCAMAGGVLLMEAAGVGQMSVSGGIPVTGQDGKLLLLCGAGLYAVSGIAKQRGGKEETVCVLLRGQGRSVMVRALKDTGNLLTDPLTGQRVLVAEYEAVKPLFPAECRPSQEALTHPAEHFAGLTQRWEPSRLSLLPFRTVGNDSGLLLTLRVDEMKVDGMTRKDRLVAVVGHPLSKKGEFQAVIFYKEEG